MVKHFIWAMAMACLLRMPLFAYPQIKSESPPVSQPLVAEGTFAFQLASALKMQNAATETEAEDALTKAGIAPENGWITDYPVTPQVMGEVRNSLLAAIDSGHLPMPRNEALLVFDAVTKENGLAFIPETGIGPENQATAAPGLDQDAINNYYYDQGPPPITYYQPPVDYGYLYDWYPYPFYAYGGYYPGFYMLNDFSFFGGLGHGVHNHGNHGFHNHGHFFAHHQFNRGADHGFNSSRNGAHSIFNSHSFNRGKGSIGGFHNHGFSHSSIGGVHGRGFSHGNGFSHAEGFSHGGGFSNSRGFSHGRGFSNSRGFSHGGGFSNSRGFSHGGGFSNSRGFSHGSIGGFHGGGGRSGGFGGHGGGFGGGHGGGGHR